MKQIFTFAAMLIAAFAPAQITITKNDMPDSGDQVPLNMTGNFGTADPSVTGPNHTWNFSFLAPDSQKVDSFVTVSSTPFAYQFYFNNIIMYPNHKASYASPVYTPNFIPQITVEEVFNFYKELTADYSFVGFGAKINGVPASVKYDSIDVIYTFPMNYGNSDSCWSKYGFSVPGFGYYGQEKHRVNSVDGWGTLTTPYGTFQVLRVRSVIDATDTIYNSSFGFGFTTQRPREIEYKWIGPGSKIPLLQVNTRMNMSNEVITGVFYRDSLQSNSVAETNAQLNFDLYPNPANEFAMMNYSLEENSDVSIELLDISGRNVRTMVHTQQNAGSHNVKIDTNDLPAGAYIMKIVVNGTAGYKKLITGCR